MAEWKDPAQILWDFIKAATVLSLYKKRGGEGLENQVSYLTDVFYPNDSKPP